METIMIVVCTVVALAVAVGWVLNIVKLIKIAGDGIVSNDMMFILRLVGVFIPVVGGVMGFVG